MVEQQQLPQLGHATRGQGMVVWLSAMSPTPQPTVCEVPACIFVNVQHRPAQDASGATLNNWQTPNMTCLMSKPTKVLQNKVLVAAGNNAIYLSAATNAWA